MGTGTRPRNRHTAGLLGALVVGVVALAAAPPAFAATLRVPQDFSSIQQAEDNANPGDLIRIQRGTYEETVEVDVNNLRFLGVGGRVVVDGDGIAGDIFDVAGTADNVTLENLTLRNAEGEAVFCPADACTIRRIVVDGDTTDDCVDINGDNYLVQSSRFIGCGDNGLELTGNGGRVRGNSARLIDGDCYQIDSGDNVVLERNLAQSCAGGDGIEFSVGGPYNGARVNGNIIRLAGEDGIEFVLPSQNPVVTHNLIQGAGGDGIELDCEVSCGSGLVQRNVVTGTLSGSGDGFDIEVADNTGTFRVLNNTASRIGGEGFNLDLFDALVRGNVASRVGATSGDGFDLIGSDNQLINNLALRGGDDGLVLNGDSDNNTLRGNLAYRNQDEGLDINSADAEDNLLDRNRATRNSQDGIENGGTDTDLTNNRSSGNGGVDCITEPGGSVDLNTGNKCADGTSF